MRLFGLFIPHYCLPYSFSLLSSSMNAGNSSKFDVLIIYIIERPGNQVSNKEEKYVSILKRPKSKHLFFL